MKIALISPIFDDLGLCSIAPLLKKEGHQVKLLFIPELVKDSLGPLPNKIILRINDFLEGAELIGINGLSENFYKTALLVNYIKKSTKSPIIWGGIHATLRPGDCISHADIVCIGEGEEAMLELASKISRREPLGGIKNLLFRNGTENIEEVKLRPPVDLDKLLPLDYDLDTQYLIENNRIRNVNEFDFEGFFSAFSSRGCPFRCTYCSNEVILDMYKGEKFLRQRSIENTINELKMIKGRFASCKKIWFNEADFLSGKSQTVIEEFSKRYKDEIGIPFGIWSHPQAVNNDNIRALKSAGLMAINIGTVNGSDRIQRQIYKRYATPQLYIDKAPILKRYGVGVEYDVILCNPYENNQDILSSIELFLKLPKPYKIVINSLTYFPRTELYEMALKDGIIKDEQYIRSYTKAAYKAWRFSGNTYLNIVHSLMRGQARKIKLLGFVCYGILPEPLLKILIKKPVIKLFERLPFSAFIYRIVAEIIITGYLITGKAVLLKKRYTDMLKKLDNI